MSHKFAKQKPKKGVNLFLSFNLSLILIYIDHPNQRFSYY